MKQCFASVFAAVFVLLVVSIGSTNAQSTFYNKTQLQLAKAAFPDANFVDLTRKITISVEKSDEPDQPFFWKVTLESERISISNQKFFTYTVFLHDFIKDDKTNFVLISDKERAISRPEPRVQMVEDEGLFHANYKVKYYQQYISRPGQIWHIKSSFLVTSFAHLSSMSFGAVNPALSSEIQIEIPHEMKIRLDSLHFDQATITRSKQVDKKKTIYNFKQLAVPASKDVSQAPDPIYYEPHVLWYTLRMTDKTGREIPLMANVNDVYSWNTSMVKRTKNDAKGLKGLVDSLTAGLDEEAKLKQLYYWVQDNIRYLAFLDGLAAFVPDACQDVYYKRFGDCKGKSNLLKEMLKIAGFDARLVWIGTRDYSFMEVSQPTIGTCNHMITAVKWQGKWLFLDPTTSYYGLYQVPDQLQGKTAMVEGSGEPIVETVPTVPMENQHISSSLRLRLSADHKEFEGQQYRYIAGGAASSIRTQHFSTAGKEQTELKKRILTNNNLNVGFSNENIDISADRDTPIHFNSDIRISNLVMELEEQVLFPTTIFSVLYGNRIHPKRRAAVSFGNKVNQNDTLIYEIPAAYEVDYLPETLNIERSKYSFKAEAVQKGNTVEVVCHIKISDFIILKQEFEQWNKDYDALTAFTKNRIVLQKKKQ